MGNSACCKTDKYKRTPHLLYHFKPFDSRLWLLNPDIEKNNEVQCINLTLDRSLFPQNMKDALSQTTTFTIAGYETISNTKGCIYMIGGMELRGGHLTTNESKTNFASNMRHSVYQETSKYSQNAVPSDLVACVDLNKINKDNECNVYVLGRLPRPRTSHTLALDPKRKHIYIVGGMENYIPTQTCLKYDLNNNTIFYIDPIPDNITLTKPASLVVGNCLYVFDCYSVNQSIYKYNIEYEFWERVIIRTKGSF